MPEAISTNVAQVSVTEMDELLGSPGADAVMVPGEDLKKPSFFSRENPDMAVFNEPKIKTEEELAAEAALAAEAKTKDVTDTVVDPAAMSAEDTQAASAVIDELLDINPAETTDSTKTGRPTLDKGGMAQLVEGLVKDQILIGFDDDKPMEDYTLDEFKSLIQENFKHQKETLEDKVPQDFFEQLPEELQYAATYVANGGTDMKGLFRALASSQDSKSIDINTESGQARAVRDYLMATQFGDAAEIQEEIDTWTDLGVLKAKAEKFKPKLDKLQEKVVQAQVKEQESKALKREEASKAYGESIYATLEKGELNGLKIDNKIQSMLYNGLMQPNYNSISGNKTNLFGHLIEKHQYVEPNHELIAEALWLLQDPEGYRAQLSKAGQNVAATEVARKLKLEQSSKGGGGGTPSARDNTSKKTLAKPNKNFWKRD